MMLVSEAFVEYKFSYAAYAVAAHSAFRTVGVENPHEEISFIGRADEDDAVATDTLMSVA